MVGNADDSEPTGSHCDPSVPNSSQHSRSVSDHSRISNQARVANVRQARYWIGTIPESDWEPALTSPAIWLTGQLEQGASGFRHYQICFAFSSKKSLRQVTDSFPKKGHYEPTRSSAAELYCNKLESRIGEPFCFGNKYLVLIKITPKEQRKRLGSHQKSSQIWSTRRDPSGCLYSLLPHIGLNCRRLCYSNAN